MLRKMTLVDPNKVAPMCLECGQMPQSYTQSCHNTYFTGYCKECWARDSRNVPPAYEKTLKATYTGAKVDWVDRTINKETAKGYEWLTQHGYLSLGHFIYGNKYYDLSLKGNLYVNLLLWGLRPYEKDFKKYMALFENPDNFHIIYLVNHLIEDTRKYEIELETIED